MIKWEENELQHQLNLLRSKDEEGKGYCESYEPNPEFQVSMHLNMNPYPLVVLEPKTGVEFESKNTQFQT